MFINNKNYELELKLALLAVEAGIIVMSNKALLDIRREGALLRYEIRIITENGACLDCILGTLKKNKKDDIRNAMKIIDSFGKPCEIMVSETMAKKWAIYSYTPGDSSAQYIGYRDKILL